MENLSREEMFVIENVKKSRALTNKLRASRSLSAPGSQYLVKTETVGLRLCPMHGDKEDKPQRVTTDKYWVLSGSPESPRLVRSNSDSWGRAHRYIGDYSQGRGRPRHRVQSSTQTVRDWRDDQQGQTRYHKQKINYYLLHPQKDCEGEEEDTLDKNKEHMTSKNNRTSPGDAGVSSEIFHSKQKGILKSPRKQNQKSNRKVVFVEDVNKKVHYGRN